ncbi:MAG: SAM-dependent methyltransferase protein [Rubritepida sp.]|nr:SAM-dependent methyltransferase protein [Rubritepida sp.]
MRVCLRCDHPSVDANWCCSECGFAPVRMDGILAFAPELALENDGMDSAAHDHLDILQDGSFWFRARNRLIGDLLQRHFPAARRVLELGCGTGYVTRAIEQALPEARINATEIYVNGLAHAAQRTSGRVELIQMDARKIPYRDEFDLVCAFDVLEHIEEDELVLERIALALVPGGGVMFSVPQHSWLWSQVDTFSHHKRRYGRAELAAKCRAAGLEIVRDTSFVTSLLPLMYLQRMTSRKDVALEPGKELALPRYLDRTLEWALDMERRVIGAGVSLPIGGSRFVVARLAR